MLGILRIRPAFGLGRARPSADSRAAFTFVEIMIALVMLALLAVVALPAIRQTRVAAAVHNSRYAVVSSISLARATAIRYGRPAALRLDSDGDALWVEADTTVDETGAGLATVGFFAVGEQYSVDLSANRSAICFNGRGIPTTTADCPQLGARIVVSLNDAADTVVVDGMGRVSEQ